MLARIPGLLPLLALVLLTVGCGSSTPAGNALTLSSSEAGNGGEGNYGGTEVTEAAITDDVTYLTQLGLMRGHLLVGVELYRTGEKEAATTHMKHPEDELYAALLPALMARGANRLDTELSTLARAVESGRPVEVVNDAYLQLRVAISSAEQAAAVSNRELGDVITELVRTAADEYYIARAENGAVANEHEYQDSYGFVLVAQQILGQLESRGANAESVLSIAGILDDIEVTWPTLVPPSRLDTVPAAVYSAAARIEIASLRL